MSFLNWWVLWFQSFMAAQRHGKLRPVERVDLSRFMGSWRVFAFVDNEYEREIVDAEETYTFAGAGEVQIHSSWRKSHFRAPLETHQFTGRITTDGTNARWRIKIQPFVASSFFIVAAAEDYSSAAVAHPSRRFGWILARKRYLDIEPYQAYMSVFAGQGYDTSQFRMVPQHPEAVPSAAKAAT